LELLHKRLNLITFTRVFQLAAGVQLNICADSKYVLTTIHVHGALYKERGLVNSGGKGIKYGQEILELLMLYGPLNGWQLYTAKGTKREMQ
jgi:hypothetical protein